MGVAALSGSIKGRYSKRVGKVQCDQIWQFIGLWANFKSLWQQ